MSIQNIRDNTQGFLSKVIIGVIVISFAAFGVNAIVNFTTSGSDAVAEVNGNKITEIDLSRATYLLKNQMLAEMGDNANPDLIDEDALTQQAMENLITRTLLVSDAQEQSLHISDEALNSAILTNSAFQGADGNFNADIYRAQVRNIGLTPGSYKTQLAYDLMLRQSRLGIAGSEFVTSLEVTQLQKLDKQTRDFDYLVVDVASLIDDSEVSNDEARAWYEDHKDSYLSDEKLVVNYLELKRSDFVDQIDVDEADLQAAYQQAVEEHEAKEERLASHILISLDDKKIDEAVAEAKDIKARIDAGESFADLAREYSDDIGSADSGGDLGYITKGIYEGPFDDALFALTKGEVSEPVESAFGIHLIQLNDVRSQPMAEFENMRAELTEQVKFDKAESLYIDAVGELENEAFSSYDLAGPADMLQLEVKTSEPFGRSGGSGIAQYSQVVDAAFSDSVLIEGNNSDMVSIDQNHVVVLHKESYQPSESLTFEQVQGLIVDALARQQAIAKAETTGQDIEARLKQGIALQDAVDGLPYQWQSHTDVTRSDAELDSEVVSAVYQLAKPGNGSSVGGSRLTGGDYLVMRLNAVNPGSSEYSDAERQSVAALLVNQKANEVYGQYQLDLSEKADIVR